MKYASISLSANGADIDINLPEDIQKCKDQVENGMKWVKRIRKIGKKVVEGEVSAVFEVIKKEIIQEKLVGKEMYFYLVDDLTGEPVRGDGYPIPITTPSDLVPKLLPLMQVGMRAMSVFNGAAGIARMFGFPFPKVPKDWTKGAQESIEMLKEKSSVEQFGVVHDAVEEGKEESKTVRGKSLRVFMDFLKENDPGLKKKKNGDFAGLRRIGDPNQGTALWTTLTDAKEINEALKERSRQRKEEEESKEEEIKGTDMLKSGEEESSSQHIGEGYYEAEHNEDTGKEVEATGTESVPSSRLSIRNETDVEKLMESVAAAAAEKALSGVAANNDEMMESMVTDAAEKAASAAAEKVASTAANDAHTVATPSECCTIL